MGTCCHTCSRGIVELVLPAEAVDWAMVAAAVPAGCGVVVRVVVSSVKVGMVVRVKVAKRVGSAAVEGGVEETVVVARGEVEAAMAMKAADGTAEQLV